MRLSSIIFLGLLSLSNLLDATSPCITTNGTKIYEEGDRLRITDSSDQPIFNLALEGDFTLSPSGGCSNNSGGQWDLSGSNISYTDGNVGIATSFPFSLSSSWNHLRLGDYGGAVFKPNSTSLIFMENAYLDGSSVWHKSSAEKASVYLMNAGHHIWYRHDSTATGTFSPAEAMRIMPNGNVGINRSNPSSKLDVGGDIHTTGNVYEDSDRKLKKNIKKL